MISQISPEFVDEIPAKITDGKLYLCLAYNAVIHKCACGCGEIVSTPLDKKNGWKMQYDGEAVSLYPSIGNGSYKCHSHYFINENNIIWLGIISDSTKYKSKKKHSKKHSIFKALKFW